MHIRATCLAAAICWSLILLALVLG